MKQLMINFGEWLIDNNFIDCGLNSSGVKLYWSSNFDGVFTMRELIKEHTKQNRII